MSRAILRNAYMIKVKTDFRAVLSAMDRLRKQSTKLIASTLNRTAFQLSKDEWPKIAEKNIKNPTPFTKKGGRYQKARANRLTAVVHLAPKQERYLLPLLAGKRVNKIVPGVIKLNRYGNIASLRGGKKVKQLEAKPGHFRKTINGTDAIWARKGGRLRPLLLFDTTLVVRKRFDFAQAMAIPAQRLMRANARHELQRAIRRARL